jgi:co-chaperonin GroES (HSP10)
MSDAMKTMRPLPGYVLVRKPPRADRTPGGIVLPDVVRTENEIAVETTVVAVTGDRHPKKGTVMPTELKAGQRVLVRAYDAMCEGKENREFEVNGESCVLVNYAAVLAVVEG